MENSTIIQAPGKIKISVIVPVYNVEKYIAACIDSILGQTYRNLELIIVDDGSEDSSYRICSTYAKKDARIKLFHRNNYGVSATRNFALSQVSGDFIGFVDADDLIHPRMYELLLRAIQEDSLGIAFCNYCMFSDNGENLKNQAISGAGQKMSKDEAFYNFYSTYDIPYVSCCTKLIGRDLIRNVNFEHDLAYGEDNLVAMQCYYRSPNITYIDDKLYFYRKNNESATNKNWSLKKLDSVFAYFKGCEFWKENKEERYHAWCIVKAYKLLLSVMVTLPKPEYKQEATDILTKLFDRYHSDLIQNMCVEKKYKISFGVIRRFPWILKIYVNIRNRTR